MNLVDIDKCDREVFYKELGTKDGKDVCIFAETVFDMLEALPPVNAIPIPEGATNGDMIMAMFPNISVYEHGSTYSVNNEYNFNSTWWNAPYKK